MKNLNYEIPKYLVRTRSICYEYFFEEKLERINFTFKKWIKNAQKTNNDEFLILLNEQKIRINNKKYIIYTIGYLKNR